jgi:hypothetical protein
VVGNGLINTIKQYYDTLKNPEKYKQLKQDELDREYERINKAMKKNVDEGKSLGGSITDKKGNINYVTAQIQVLNDQELNYPVGTKWYYNKKKNILEYPDGTQITLTPEQINELTSHFTYKVRRRNLPYIPYDDSNDNYY